MSREVLAEGLFTHRAHQLLSGLCVSATMACAGFCVSGTYDSCLLILSHLYLFIITGIIYLCPALFFYSLWQFSRKL